MATSFPRFPRLGLSFKSSSSRQPDPDPQDTEDWYIPYNGPYELPKDIHHRPERDSWGNLIHRLGNNADNNRNGQDASLHHHDDDDAVTGDRDLFARYGDVGDTRSGSDVYGRDDRTGRLRHRVVSDASRSSGTIDPSRKSLTSVRSPGRRSHFSHTATALRPPVPSFTNLDSSGGVGESPAAPHRPPSSHQQKGSDGNRTSIASLFAFGGSSRKSLRSSSVVNLPQTNGDSSNKSPPQAGPSTYRDKSSQNRGRANTVAHGAPSEHGYLSKHDDEEYYNSYYSTLATTPTASKSRPWAVHSKNSDHEFSAVNANPNPSDRDPLLVQLKGKTKFSSSPLHPPHPYSYVFPSLPGPAPPNSAPPMHSPLHSQARFRLHTTGPNGSQTFTLPTVTLATPSKPVPPHLKSPSPGLFLKNSISTPNLRDISPQGLHTRAGVKTAGGQLPKGKDRWFSAETWCDALIFPRPRFKLKRGLHDEKGSVPRIVSPPGSPILQNPLHGQQHKGKGRMQEEYDPFARLGGDIGKLNHSKSLVDLLPSSSSPAVGTSTLPPVIESRGNPPSRRVVPGGGLGAIRNEATAPPVGRPRSFAQDDLALPSPVPSLWQVLEEGEHLDQQRKKWQRQASRSFQNKRTRSLSRNRARSIGKRGGDSEKPLGSFNFLATRTFLGSQDIAPVVHLPPFSRSHAASGGLGVTTFSSNTHSRTHSHSFSHSHSHSNSHSNSHSHSHSHTHSHTHSHASSQRPSKVGHQRGHSRNESWGKSAFKLAKSTATMCGLQGDQFVSPVDEKDATDVEKEQVITVGESHRDLAPFEPAVQTNGPSPVPSAEVGIALSTPPVSDEHPRESHDLDPIRLPDHPYAQGAVHPHKAPVVAEHQRSHSSKGSDYAGPHPSSRIVPAVSIGANDVSTRHRLPPQATLHPYAQSSHPYASTGTDDDERSRLHVHKLNSGVPSPAKMYAQISPNSVQEIVADDIKYSPYLRNSDDGDNNSMREYLSSFRNRETLTIGEALAYSLDGRGSRDSGIGGSEEQTMGVPWDNRHEQVGAAVNGQLSRYDPQSSHSRQVSTGALPSHFETPRQQTQSSDPISNQTIASSGHLFPPSHLVNTDNRGTSTSTSSPLNASSGSSPQIGPRPLGGVDDIDHFRDLFTRPTQSRSPSVADAIEQAAVSPVPHNASPPPSWDLSAQSLHVGLTGLRRQLTDELEELNANVRSSTVDTLDHNTSINTSILSGRSSRPFGSLRGRRPTELSTSSPFVLSEGTVLESPSPIETTLPLLPQEEGSTSPPTDIPEDVESSRASSIMETSPVEDDTFGVFRLGLVEAVITPPAVPGRYRGSSHFSVAGEEHEHENRNDLPEFTQDSARVISSSTLHPSLDPSRSSYTTSDTDGSRVSGLSDFPAPPLVSSADLTLFQSFVDNVTSRQPGTPETEAPSIASSEHASETERWTESEHTHQQQASYRMTFGGDEDIENISGAPTSRF